MAEDPGGPPDSSAAEPVALSGSPGTPDPAEPGEAAAVPPSEEAVPMPLPGMVDGTPTPPDLASSRWLDTETADPAAGLGEVAIAVTNDTGGDLDLEVALVSLGLDGRMVRVPVERARMAGRVERVVRVPVDRLGIKTRASAGELLVQLAATGPDGSVRTYHGEPRWYHFDDAYRRIVLYGEGVLLERFAGGRLEEGLVEAEGRFLDGGVEREQAVGTTRALTSVDGRAASGRYLQGPTTVMVLSGDDDEGDPAPGGSVKGGPAAPAAGLVRLCTTWRASLADAGIGEDYWTSTSPGDHTAAWARYVVRDSSYALVSSGYLDVAGCTPDLPLSVGTYYLYQETDLQKGSIDYAVRKPTLLPGYLHDGVLSHYSLAGYALVTSITFTHDPYGAAWVHPSAVTNYTRLMTQIGYFLNRPDHGMPDGSHKVLFDMNCPGYSDPVSCYSASSNAIWMDASACDKKFIFTHETGHQVQIVSTGQPALGYGATVTEASCRCDHVSPPQYQAHCLQSREYTYTAIIEGFGYFYVAKPWNYMSGSDCRIAHPKAFRLDGGVIVGPPYVADCRTPQRWMENHCLTASRGVEWDWMNFFWNWHTVTTDKATMADIYDVIRQACGGWCSSGDSIGWSHMNSAAAAKWGSSGAKFLYFATTGSNNGVNH